MCLCMDKKTISDFEGLNPQTKSAFTKMTNAEMKEDLKGKKVGPKKGKTAKVEN